MYVVYRHDRAHICLHTRPCLVPCPVIIGYEASRRSWLLLDGPGMSCSRSMCMDMCKDMCIDTCIGMFTNMCIDVYIDVCIDMCMGVVSIERAWFC